MSKKVLTIVIPSYNTAKFIDKNIPAFLEDRILDNIEVLIINDGSTDYTAGLARRYEEKYPGTVSVVNKKNGGHEYLIAQKNQSVSDENALKNQHMFYAVIQDCIMGFEEYKKSLSYNKQTYMLRTILELIRSQYNIYLRNGFMDGTYEKMVNFNQDLKKRYPFYFHSVAERYGYIKKIQNEERIIFKVFSLILGIYKKIMMR